MFFFKTESRYEYLKEVNNKVFVDPLFYSAYQYARKALIDKFPEDEVLNNIETKKEYYSLDLKLKPKNILKETRMNTHLNREQEVESVEVSEFFFMLIEILPFYYSYRMYSDANAYMPELEISLKGPRRYSQNYENVNNLTRITNTTKNRLYKRGINEKVNTLNINYLFIYLGLGQGFFPTVTSFDIYSVNDYLTKLNKTIIEIKNSMDMFTPSKKALLSLLPNVNNETRASFFNSLEPNIENFEEYLFVSVINLDAVVQPYFYPINIQKKEVNPEHYISTPTNLDYLSTENEPLINKIKNNENTSGFINVESKINETLLSNGYNMRLICEKGESRYYYFRKTMNHENLNGHKRSSLLKLMELYNSEMAI